MKNKILFLITTISMTVFLGLLIAGPWAWFWFKGFSATNAPLAWMRITSEEHEVFDRLINNSIKIGSPSDNLPPANAVWNFGDYSEYWYYLDCDPENPNTYFTKIKIGCRQGRVILAKAMHGHEDSQWTVVFFESGAQGMKEAWEKKYGSNSG